MKIHKIVFKTMIRFLNINDFEELKRYDILNAFFCVFYIEYEFGSITKIIE